MELKVDVTTDRKKKVFLNIIFYYSNFWKLSFFVTTCSISEAFGKDRLESSESSQSRPRSHSKSTINVDGKIGGMLFFPLTSFEITRANNHHKNQ